MKTRFDDLAQKIKRKIYGRYGTSHLVEDLAQEAVIEGWKMYMDDREDGYILFWAAQKVSRYLGTEPEPFTGSTDSRGGHGQSVTTAEGDAQREKIKQAQREYMQLHGKKPSNAEVGRMIGMDPRRVSKYVNRANFNLPPKATTAPVIAYFDGWVEASDEGDMSYIKALAEESFEETSIDKILVDDMLPELKEREREVVYLHYWQDLPQADIARELKISPAYTHRVHKEAIGRLRTLMGVS